MKRPLLILFIITCTGSLPAQVINYEIDPTFDTGELFTKGAMYDFAVRDDDIVISFNRRSGISEAHEQCIIDLSGNLLDNIYDAPTNSIELYKFGRLSWYGGGVGHRILPPHPDAGVNFDFRFEFSEQEYIFQNFSSQSTGVLILEDETILATGRFSTDSINPGPDGVRHLVRVDSSGAPVEGFSMVRCEPWWAIMNSVVQTSEGKYVVSGEFTEINGVERNYIARLNADFSVDTTFFTPFVETTGDLTIFYQDSSDHLWVSGKDLNTANEEIQDNSLLKLLPNGALDPNFQIPEITTYYENGEPLQLSPGEIWEDTDGNFILAGTMMLYNGVDVNRLIKVTPNGELIPNAFGVLGPDEADWGDWAVFHPAEVNIVALKKLEDGKLLLGGQFSSFGGEPYSCMVRLQPDGFVGTEDSYAEAIGLKVWPNPAKDRVQIESTEPILSASLLDLTGKTLIEQKLVRGMQIVRLDDVPPGVYLLRCRTENNIATTKIVILE